MKHQGSCSCGAVQMALLTDPIFKYYCHCSHCRRFASQHQCKKQPYYPSTGVWVWTLQLLQGEDKIEYENTVGAWGLFSLARGRCQVCKDPVWEKGGRAAMAFAMVAVKPFQETIEPDMNLYYGSGLKQGPHNVKTTIYSDLGSFLYEMWIVLAVAIPALPSSLWARWKYTKISKKKD